MLATFVDRVQLQDDCAELWMQSWSASDKPTVEIGMRWAGSELPVHRTISRDTAALLAGHLWRLSQRDRRNMTVASTEQFPDY